ncbi:MAG TPA: Asp-tRNA(Asn)/Glu-tRNA(Gln) amidotransferase subunit GatC [Candidatus Paceibacterota bacterium]|nr:Asp-tRNA(Asn)/Glu-tRNA(Gln) amidotransferase subunit GatC [Candidatus Paceibacterota bacterium]HMP19156.1 Asp-tRNA(Asn)/Glu-tRNA(Gln) amidotransferase subunit GatC [Candidatus Paceibacterota bacterium]HMP85207.1 Asp-tRNA(Asn)/Glu-tRNA(Gln) amidotransferase subunit GatC [Candidatus Paceibacterota bacterium]
MNKQDVKKISDLARIEMSEEELEKMSSEIESVLGYVDQIKTAVSDSSESRIESVNIRNAFRDLDEKFEENEIFETDLSRRKNILDEAPETEGDYIKVKKIL